MSENKKFIDPIMVGEALARARERAHLTQEELAEAIGVSNKTISRWECGQYLSMLNTFIGMCITLGVSPNELLSY